jgi:hypothetical protein
MSDFPPRWHADGYPFPTGTGELRIAAVPGPGRYKPSSLRVRFINSFEGNSGSSTFRAVATPATGSFPGSNRPNWTRIDSPEGSRETG